MGKFYDNRGFYQRVSRRLCASVALALMLAGCANQQQSIEAIDVSAISTVQAEIKRQIGVFMAASQSPVMVKVNNEEVDVSKHPELFSCGRGDINFDVTSVKAELTTTVTNSGDFKAGVSVPVHLITWGPSLEFKHSDQNTETLDYGLWPIETNPKMLKLPPPTKEELQDAPIASALLALRKALVLSAMNAPGSQQPCFRDFNPDKPGDDANTFKLGLSIIDDGSGGISVKTAVLSLSATGESVSTTGNTLTVSFMQSGLEALLHLKANKDKECKEPNEASPACAQAKADLDKATRDSPVGVGFQ